MPVLADQERISAVTMYTTPWCGYCVRLKRMLEAAKVVFREVNIERDTAAGDRIAAYTGGFRTVPTIDLGDRLLVNPSVREVEQALGAPGT
jgi:mycoredoxin